MSIDDFKLYLPKHLTSESKQELFDSLNDFPNNLDQRFYTSYLSSQSVVFQGDGIRNLLAVNLPSNELKEISGIILSNTCDIDDSNVRNFDSQVIYAPIITLHSYHEMLSGDQNLSEQQISDHIDAIKQQSITQIFYLPQLTGVIDESLVFLDRIFNIQNDFIDRNNLEETRLFTLSDYGNYLFLFKLSLHFTRIQDGVERKAI